MGLFDFLPPPSPVHPLLSLLTSLPSWTLPSPTAPAHDLSFDLMSTPSRTSPTRFPPTPTPVSLPLEVVLSIIEMASYDENTLDRVLLKRCALVCRAWSAPSQKLLFSHVTLRTRTASDAFRTAIDRSTEHGRFLSDAILRLRIVIDHNQPFGISERAFAGVVNACPNLYELNLALYGSGPPGQDFVGAPDVVRIRHSAPSFDDETLGLLRSGPMIKALQFSNWSENQQSVTQLLDVWPSLTSLVMSGTPPQPPSPFLVPFHCPLREVRMNFQKSPSIDFVDWLLHNSVHTLRVLELEREPSIHLLDHLVNAHGPSLHSLSLPSCSTPEYAVAVQKCRRLKELCVENPVTTPKLFKDVPKGLVHIALGLNRNTSLQAVIDTVRSSESIKVLTVNVHNDCEHHPQLSVLKMVCAYQGVELRITKDVQVFRSTIRGDPVLTTIFPRTRTLDNLCIMRS